MMTAYLYILKPESSAIKALLTNKLIKTKLFLARNN